MLDYPHLQGGDVKNYKAFESDDPRLVTCLFDGFPAAYTSISGGLACSTELDGVIPGSELSIDGPITSLENLIRAASKNTEEKVLTIAAILSGERRTQKFSVLNCNTDTSLVTFQAAVKLARKFIAKNYTGRLRFYFGSRSEPSASCVINAEEKKAQVILEWEDESRSYFRAVFETLSRFGFKELEVKRG